MAAPELSPANRKLAAKILAGIEKARPHDSARPKDENALIAMALTKLVEDVERVFPEYFEIKPARTLRKTAVA